MKTAFEMALEAGFFQGDGDGQGVWLANDQELKVFAELVRADEREECAKVCDDYDDEYDVHTRQTVEGIALQIRARGEIK